GTTETITADCTNLDIQGNNADVTINSGVTIDDPADKAVTNSGTATSLNNSGTISAGDDFGLFNNASSITTLTNSGTITAADDYGIKNHAASTITTLTNSGTISAGDYYGLFNSVSGTIGTLTNESGAEISSANDFGLLNRWGGVITTLTNAGTISAEDKGLYNYGTINELTNSGTISADGSYGFVSKKTGGIDATIGTLTNSGTISAATNHGLWHSGGTITTLTNSGTIKATNAYNGIYNRDSATITTLTNTGTISAGLDYGIRNNTSSVITTLNNSGTITAGDDYGIHNGSTITTLINSGTISADDDYGLYNADTITTLTNTGTISASGNGIGIWNDSTSTITTLNNSQGDLTYKGTLPTNYNVIINSTSDFGKITFSSVLGTLNFGVTLSDSADLCEVCEETTYSSVVSGLSSSDIDSGTSGSFTSGARTHNWTLENSSGNLWDLVIASIADDTNTSVENLKPNVLFGINNLNSVADANTNYDCDLFGEDNLCFSLGGRHVSNPTTPVSVNSLIFVGGIKVSEKLRLGGFLHSNVSHKTPSNFSLSDKTPLLGTFLVWNEKENKLGYQFKLGNAFQEKNASITRPVVGTSVEGLGKTVIGAESYLAELQYAHQFSDTTILKPYFAARHASITQDAYTETGKCALTFNKIKDKSNTILSGLKFESALTSKFSLNGNFGVEHDVNHSINKIKPTGISDLTTVSLENSFNRTRAVVSAGFDYYFSPAQRLSVVFQYQELAYESETESNAYINYTIEF
ncbi:MAG: hypothetical protein QF502_10435, partial [Nitrospinaceae bacterium]|nr:hypothetical protein [Nitrospinaceae bacterium]